MSIFQAAEERISPHKSNNIVATIVNNTNNIYNILDIFEYSIVILFLIIISLLIT